MSMPDRELNKLYEDIGYIKSKVEKIDNLDDRLFTLEAKVGKILAYAGATGAVFGLMMAFAKDYVRRIFNLNA